MTGVDSYSVTPATNATAVGGAITYAEGQAPSTVNNSARQMMADVRALVNDSPWFQYGSGDQGAGNLAVPAVYASGTSFTIAGVDVRAAYHPGRRVRAVGNSTGTIYGTITTSTFSGNTTVTVTWDSGSLSNETLVISIALPVTGNPLPGLDAVSVDAFGPAGDGATDDTTALNKAFSSGATRIYIPPKTYGFSGTVVIPAGVTVFGNGCGSASILRPLSSTGVCTVNGNNVTVRDLTYSGHGYGLKVGNSSTTTGFKALNVEFNSYPANTNSLTNAIWLHVCSDILVQGCKFNQVTYGVLQQGAKTCTDVRLVNNIILDTYGDFANFNGGAGHAPAHVLVHGNIYLGSNSYPSGATEERFLSYSTDTTATYFTVTNNYIANSAGDAPIHFEGGGFNLINGNIFVDCKLANGNDGYIYLLDTPGQIEISDNTFIQTSAISDSVFAVSANGGYSNLMTLSDNVIVDVAGQNVFGAFDLAAHTGETLISGNHMYGGNIFVQFNTSANKRIIGNTVIASLYGVYSANVALASGGGSSVITVDNNYFDVADYAIRSGKNTNGTSPPDQWIVRNNTFNSTSAPHDGVLISSLTQGWATGNYYASNLLNTTIASSAGANTTEKNDFQNGTGLIHP